MITLHRAPWVLPISSPAIADGAVVVDDEQILAVGPYADMRDESHDTFVDHESRILMPGLVNAHCHLELSPFAELSQHPLEPGNMPAWIADLLALRDGMDTDEIDSSVCLAALAAQYADGVGLLVDIGNALSPSVGAYSGVDVHYFTELLGLSKQGTAHGLQIMAKHGPDHQFTGHAPYSTSGPLLQAVKKRTQQTEQLFPIHVAESLDEVDFLKSGKGRFRSFLEERGVWDGSFTAPGLGPVAYLDQLNLVDEKTLCVHCVHLDDEEIALLSRRKAKVCLCPGSNRFLGVGKAQADMIVDAGIRPCLGTDSLASNPELSIWREMTILAEDHPGLDPEIIVAMATYNGAEAVADPRRGRLEKGCCPQFLEIGYNGTAPFDFLACEQGAKAIAWI
ncbi:MAG: amidohydrolase family protein [Thermodesulfobacteriota bacterium]